MLTKKNREAAKLPNKVAKTSFISKVRNFVNPSMSSGFISQLPKLSLPKIPTSGLAKSTLKLGGKMFRPLSVMTDVASISTAKPGKERNKAIGGALGGWGGMAAGAAIGSVVPIVGTVIGGAIGGLAGSFAGEWIGKNAGGVAKKASKWIGGIFGGKKKEKMDPVPAQPVTAIPMPSTQPINTRQSATGRQQSSPVSIHVSLPVGAVQLKVDDKLNYDELSAIIGSKIAVSIQQAMENRV